MIKSFIETNQVFDHKYLLLLFFMLISKVYIDLQLSLANDKFQSLDLNLIKTIVIASDSRRTNALLVFSYFNFYNIKLN